MAEWVVALILLALCLVVVLLLIAMCHVVKRVTNVPPLVTDSKSLNCKTGLMNDQTKLPVAVKTNETAMNCVWKKSTTEKSEVTAGSPTSLSELRTSPTSVDSVSVVSENGSHSDLPRALSCDSVLSDTSVTDAETAGSPAKIGQLEFGLEYERDTSELIVSVIQARDLEKNEVMNGLDSYVKLWIAPHTEGKMQTKIQKDSLNPMYLERFSFSVEREGIVEKVLQFQVYSCDKYARQRLIGETELRLGDIDLKHPVRLWMNLHDMDEKPEDYGDVMFSLSYLPTAERLTVVVAKTRNLKWPTGRLMGDCCVKVYLSQNGKRVAKKRTSMKRNDKNPIFNESMMFSIPSSVIHTVHLKVSVIVTMPDGKIHRIGHAIVGPHRTGTELAHWTQAMTSLRKPITMWHRLQK